MLVTEELVSSSAGSITEGNSTLPAHRLTQYFQELDSADQNPEIPNPEIPNPAVLSPALDSLTLPKAITPACMHEASRVAHAIGRYFIGGYVRSEYIDKDHTELGCRFEFSLPSKYPWEGNFIPNALSQLSGFELLITQGDDFFNRNRPTFRFHLDQAPERMRFPEIEQRVFEGTFYFLAPLNGPYV